MEFNAKVLKIKEIKDRIKELYIEKNRLEKEVIEEIENGETPFLATHTEVIELVVLYKDRLDLGVLRELYPTVYNFGQKFTFDWEQASLAFDSPNDFWKLVKNCKVKEKSLKVRRKR